MTTDVERVYAFRYDKQGTCTTGHDCSTMYSCGDLLATPSQTSQSYRWLEITKVDHDVTISNDY